MQQRYHIPSIHETMTVGSDKSIHNYRLIISPSQISHCNTVSGMVTSLHAVSIGAVVSIDRR